MNRYAPVPDPMCRTSAARGVARGAPARARAVARAVTLTLALVGAAIGSNGPAVSGAAQRARGFAHRGTPVIVQRKIVTVAGLIGHRPGPRRITVRFPHPTRRGDLLVAGVDDGVESSGMVHARYRFPGWRRAVSTIGGQRATTGRAATGGLQAAIYYLPDNPGGIVAVPVAVIPPGSLDWVSVVLVELAHSPPAEVVDTVGTSTDGPSPKDYSLISTVRTRHATTTKNELVLAVFNNGGNAPHGVRFVNSPGWTVLGEVHDPNNDQQPILLDFRVQSTRAVVTETDRYLGGTPIDNCAAIAALRSRRHLVVH